MARDNVILPSSPSSGAAAAADAPVAMFLARQEQMTTFFDASGSYSPIARAIVSYAWDFGDGEIGTGPIATHTYTTPGRYTVLLEVTDSYGLAGNTSRYVSPAPTTVDILLDRFFEANCPYPQYWYLRYDSYGDQILSNEVPCATYFPWVLFSASTALQPLNPSHVHGLYRLDARVSNHSGYNVTEPVFLPVFDSSVLPAPDSFVTVDFHFVYLDTPTIDFLRTYEGGAWAVSAKYSDGFGYLLQGNLTMDLTMSKRIFGVEGSTPEQAQRSWYNLTGTGARDRGPLETAFAQWLENNGDGKYDIWNGFEWYYETDITYLNGTVDPDGTTHVRLFWDGWGLDTLLARWFYWGNASYRDAVCVAGQGGCTATLPYGAIEPKGWMPMELCRCESANISAMLRTSLDLHLTAVNGYHLKAWANPGMDGLWNTTDDQPAWVFEPLLMDYVPRYGSGSPGAGGYGNSELRWYEGLTRVHATPGSYSYGEPYEYIETPARWRFEAGSTLTMVLPTFPLVWYDPIMSEWDPFRRIGQYVAFTATATLRDVRSPGVPYVWDSATNVLSFAGPRTSSDLSLPLEGSPWVELAPVWSPDLRPPMTTASLLGTQGLSGWWKTAVTVALDATDFGLGVASTWYRIDGGTPTRYAGSFAVGGDGNHTLEYWSIDYAGNWELVHTLPLSIDTSPPAYAIDLEGANHAGWYTSTTFVAISGSDGVSGLAAIRFSLDAGSWQDYLGPFLMGGDGVRLVHVNLTDRAGNAATVDLEVPIDATPPTPRLETGGTKGADGWFITQADVTLAAMDGGSGVASLRYRIDGGAWTDYAGVLTIGDGIHDLQYQANDRAGNAGSVVATIIKVDTSKPSVYFLTAPGTVSRSDVEITWVGTDTGSGVAGYEVSVDDGPYGSASTATRARFSLSEGEHTVRVRASDVAGNSNTATLVFRVDTNLFSPSGPYSGLPTYLILVAGVAAACFMLLRRRKRRPATVDALRKEPFETETEASSKEPPEREPPP